MEANKNIFIISTYMNKDEFLKKSRRLLRTQKL